MSARSGESAVSAPFGPPRARVFEALLRDVDRITREVIASLRTLPSYAAVPAEALHDGAAGHIRAMVSATRDRRTAPTPEERRRFAATGETRAHQGVPVQDLLRGWRVGIDHVWRNLNATGARLGLDDSELLADLQTLLAFTDEAMIAASEGHRRADFELARQELEHRARFVRGVLFGSLSPAELRGQAEVYGLDASARYRAFRAHATSTPAVRHVERALALGAAESRRRGLLTTFEGDVVGLAMPAATADAPVAIGIGPAAPLEAMGRSFALASRALSTATAIGLTGVHAFDDLGVWPAIVDDRDIGEHLVERYVQPLRRASRPADLLLETVAAFLESGMNVARAASRLHVHPNTLRYRLTRIAEAAPIDFDDPSGVCELWWALQFAQLDRE